MDLAGSERSSSSANPSRELRFDLSDGIEFVFTEPHRILRSPPQAPRANAICERLIGTLRREVLDHTLILNQTHLRTVLTEYVAHYNSARPHQGIAQRVPEDDPEQPTAQVIDLDTARIRRKPILGGISPEYHIAA